MVPWNKRAMTRQSQNPDCVTSARPIEYVAFGRVTQIGSKQGPNLFRIEVTLGNQFWEEHFEICDSIRQDVAGVRRCWRFPSIIHMIGRPLMILVQRNTCRR